MLYVIVSGFVIASVRVILYGQPGHPRVAFFSSVHAPTTLEARISGSPRRVKAYDGKFAVHSSGGGLHLGWGSKNAYVEARCLGGNRTADGGNQ